MTQNYQSIGIDKPLLAWIEINFLASNIFNMIRYLNIASLSKNYDIKVIHQVNICEQPQTSNETYW